MRRAVSVVGVGVYWVAGPAAAAVIDLALLGIADARDAVIQVLAGLTLAGVVIWGPKLVRRWFRI